MLPALLKNIATLIESFQELVAVCNIHMKCIHLFIATSRVCECVLGSSQMRHKIETTSRQLTDNTHTPTQKDFWA